jgi:hypothetical protein
MPIFVTCPTEFEYLSAEVLSDRFETLETIIGGLFGILLVVLLTGNKQHEKSLLLAHLLHLFLLDLLVTELLSFFYKKNIFISSIYLTFSGIKFLVLLDTGI